MQRLSDERRRDERAARGAFWKALKVYNHIANIAKHFKEGLDSIAASEKVVMKFTRIRPLGIPSEAIPELTSDEVDFLLKSDSAEILMTISESLARYDSIRFAMMEYKTRHEAFYELMPPPVEGDGTLFTHILNPQQHEKIMPYALMMDRLLESIIELLSIAVQEGDTTLTQFEPKMRAYFGKWNLGYEGNIHEADLSEHLKH